MRGSALQSKAKCQLAEVPVCRVGTSLDGNEELRCGIIRAALVLNEEQVLPLQRSSEAEIEANGVYGDVGRPICKPRNLETRSVVGGSAGRCRCISKRGDGAGQSETNRVIDDGRKSNGRR